LQLLQPLLVGGYGLLHLLNALLRFGCAPLGVLGLLELLRAPRVQIIRPAAAVVPGVMISAIIAPVVMTPAIMRSAMILAGVSRRDEETIKVLKRVRIASEVTCERYGGT
jgi:hypothetical protein